MEAAAAVESDARSGLVDKFWEIVRPTIVYEDDAIVCINKPSGMLSVPGKVATIGKRDRKDEWMDAVRITLTNEEVAQSIRNSLAGNSGDNVAVAEDVLDKLRDDDRIPRKRAKFCSFLHRCHRISDAALAERLFDSVLANDRAMNGFQYEGRDLSTVSAVELLTETIGPVRVCHRLDQETSGILLLAKSEGAHRELSRQFREREPRKAYIARLEGLVDRGRSVFTVDVPIRSDYDNRPYQIVDLENGKPSVTHVRVDSLDAETASTVVHLYPVTGRTHQLRLHMQHIGHPILGDQLYGSTEGRSRVPRLQLHAHTLRIRHPSTNEELTLVAPCEFATLTTSDLGWAPESAARAEAEKGEDGADDQS